MSVFHLIFGVIVVFVVLCFLGLYLMKAEDNAKNVSNFMDMSRKQYERGMGAEKIGTAVDALDQIRFGLKQTEELMPEKTVGYYQESIRSIQSHIDSLVEDKWEQKTEACLNEFLFFYEQVMNPAFSNLENARRAAKLCLACYDKYWNYTRELQDKYCNSMSDRDLFDHARDILKWEFENRIGNTEEITDWDYFKSKPSARQQIEKRLNDRIYAMQPEYMRKMQLKGWLIATITEQGTVQRSRLLSTQYDGFIESEIRACYRGLLAERIILETKQGSRYFVSMTDAGSKRYLSKATLDEKRKTKQEKPVAMQAQVLWGHAEDRQSSIKEMTDTKEDMKVIQQKVDVLYDAVIKHLQEEGVEYIDKTLKGGGLYFFDESVAVDLKEKGYTVAYAEKGSRSTGHRPAWYMKFNESKSAGS